MSIGGVTGYALCDQEGNLVSADSAFELWLCALDWHTGTSLKALPVVGNCFTALLQAGSVRHEVIHVAGISYQLTSCWHSPLSLYQLHLKPASEIASTALWNHPQQAVMLTDKRNRITSVNTAFEVLTGFTLTEMFGEDPKKLGAGHLSHDYFSTIWTTIEETGQWKGELWNRHKKGNIYPVWANICQIEQGYLATFTELSSLKGEQELLAHPSHKDKLTTLPDQPIFLDLLGSRIERAVHLDEAITVLLVDLEKFKWINESLGYEMGDATLREIAKRLTAATRNVDLVARYSSDEFVIMLPEMEPNEQAEAVAQRILEQLVRGIWVAGREILLSASVGIAGYPMHGKSAEQLVRHAHQAMRAAQKAGHNGYKVFTTVYDPALRPAAGQLEELFRTIESEALSIRCRPIYNLESHNSELVKILPCWHHDQLGSLLPADFVPLLQDELLLARYERWLFKQLAQLLRQLDNYVAVTGLLVRLDGVQLQPEKSLQRLLDYFQHHEINPAKIIFQVSSSVAVEHEGELFDLQASGVRIALQGLEQHPLSLQQLEELDPDYLNIDASLIESSEHKKLNTQLELAEQGGFNLIADNITGAGQLSELQAHGCTRMQGRYFGCLLTTEQLLGQLAMES